MLMGLKVHQEMTNRLIPLVPECNGLCDISLVMKLDKDFKRFIVEKGI